MQDTNAHRKSSLQPGPESISEFGAVDTATGQVRRGGCAGAYTTPLTHSPQLEWPSPFLPSSPHTPPIENVYSFGLPGALVLAGHDPP
jgi:hypothetical protein